MCFITVYGCYVLVQRWKPPVFSKPDSEVGQPISTLCIRLIGGLILITFVVRIWFPVGWTLQPVGFQLAHFPQYILLFMASITAYHSKLLLKITPSLTQRWRWAAIGLIAIGFPLIYVLKVLTDSPTGSFGGGWRWQSLLYAGWEQATGIALIVTLLGWARVNWNRNQPVLALMAWCSYGVYIIHPFAVVGLSLWLRHWRIDPVWKIGVVASLAIISSHVVASVLVRLPGVRSII